MEYGRLGPSDPGGSSRLNNVPPTSSGRKKIVLLSLFSVLLIAASAVTAVVVRSRIQQNTRAHETRLGKPTQAISRTCSKTRFKTLCVKSLLDFPGSEEGYCGDVYVMNGALL